MNAAALSFAFTAGLVAAFNPCGFAMLPAYLSYFVGADEVGGEGTAGVTPSRGAAIARALAVAGTVSAGFVIVFGIFGIIATQISSSITRYTPYATLVIGIALIPLGVAMIRGFKPSIPTPRIWRKGADDRGLAAMALFGVSYAVVSLGCTLPVFLGAVATSFGSGSFAEGISVYLAYAAGMALVLTVLTVAVALARGALVAKMRRVLPHVYKVSGVLLVIAGAYVAYYGYYSLQVENGRDVPAGPVDFVTNLSGRFAERLQTIGVGKIAIAGALLLLAIIIRAVRRRAKSH